jgi:hypothetical protein
MHLGVPFIAPRQLGAVGGTHGRQFLPFVGWRTGQSGAPPDIHCSWSSADLLPKMAQLTLQNCSHWRTGHCPVPLPTVGAGHTSPVDLVADRCAGGRWLTGQSGALPDSPVNYNRTPPTNSREWPVRQSPAWRIGHCPVHHRTVRCTQTELSLGCFEPSSLLFFSLIPALRQIC